MEEMDWEAELLKMMQEKEDPLVRPVGSGGVQVMWGRVSEVGL